MNITLKIRKFIQQKKKTNNGTHNKNYLKKKDLH